MSDKLKHDDPWQENILTMLIYMHLMKAPKMLIYTHLMSVVIVSADVSKKIQVMPLEGYQSHLT
jgi:hypothetical protein